MRKLLVVDDSDICRELLKKILADKYEIIEAANGREAISLMYKEYKTISAVLLDVQMPVMNGYQVLKMRRCNPILAQIPVIILTASDDEETKKKALELEAVAVLTKPFRTKDVIDCLTQFVQKLEMNKSAKIGNFDHLTQIYQRAYFFEKASTLIEEHNLGYYFISCVNIEGFKIINDQYGTNIGDRLLQHVAKVLKKGTAKIGGICGRIGADDFIVLTPTSVIKSKEIEEIYQNAISPNCLPQKIRIRIGRYFINDSTIPISTMYDRAKIAADSIRGNYDKYIAEYSDIMRDNLVREQKIVSEMESALQNGQFEPWFQPQYNHSTGAMIGAEVLVRWNKNRTYISPADFIPIFEQNGFIYEMDKSIWEQSCKLLRKWIDEGISPLPISVNISRKDIYHNKFINTLTGLIEKYRIPADLIRLEVTESSFSESTKVIVAKVNELIALGFTVEIDDFGSGYSSLNTLKDVPASILKLDMRFFENTENNQRSGNIVESIVRMAKWIGMAVIAEGVENKEQADYLKSIGCYYIQGYFYAKPMPVEEYEKLLNSSLQEAQLTHMQTLTTLDNNEFWNPKSMDTLIYNSYVGAACIIEYTTDKIEMIRVNEFYEEMLGSSEMSIHDMLSFDWIAHMDEKTICAFSDAVTKSTETKKSVTIYPVFHNVPGCPEKVYLKTNLRVIATTIDRYLIYCLNENITAQIEAEQQRQESARTLEIIMNNVSGGVSAIIIRDDGSSEVVFSNSKYYELYGYTREQALADNIDIMHLISPKDIDSVMKKINKLKQDKKPVIIDYSIKKRNGSLALLRANASLMSFPGYGDDVIISVITDITEKKSLEDQLTSIIDNINGAVSATYIKDGQPQFSIVNDQFFDLLGYSTREEYESEHPNKYTGIHPEDRDRIIKQFETSDGGKTRYTMNYRIIRKDGEVRYIRNNISVINMFGIDSPVQLSVANDITEKKLAEIKERNITTQMKVIMANVQGGITATLFRNQDAIEYIFANDGFYEIYGYTREQLAAEMPNTLDLILPEDRKKTMETVERIVKNRGSETYEYRCYKRDGSIIWIKCTNSVISIEGVGDTVLLGVSFDITKEHNNELEKSIAIDRLRTVMDSMTNGMTAVAINGETTEFLFANNRYYEIHGINKVNNNVQDLEESVNLVHPDDRDKIRSFVLRATKIGETVTEEYRILRSDGEIRWLRTVINVIKMINVDAPVQVSIFMDITDQKKANNQIHFLNELARNILAQPDSEKAINDTLQKLLNYFACERTYIFELQNQTRTSNNTYEICAPGITSEIERLQSVPYETQQYWFDIFDKKGFVAISDVASIDDNEAAMRELLLVQNIHSIIVAPLWRNSKLIGYIGVDNPTKAVDQVSQLIAITDFVAVLLTRRDLMSSVEHGLQTVQQLIDDTPGGFLRLQVLPDNTPVIVSLNAGFCRLLGMTADEIMAEYGDDAHKCMVEEDIATVRDIAAKSLENDGMYTYKCRLKKKDGTIIWVQVFGRYAKDENGKQFRNSYFTDITEQKSLEQLQTDLLDNLPFGAAMYDYDGNKLNAIHINKSYWKLVKRNAIGTVIGALHPDDRIIIQQEIESAIRQNRNPEANCRILSGDGGYLPFHVVGTISPLENEHWILRLVYSPIDKAEMSLQEMLPIALSTMVSCSDDISYVKDKDLRFICVSRSIAKMVEAESPRDLVGKTIEEVLDHELAKKLHQDDLHIIESGETITRALEHIPYADGSIHIARTSKYPILNSNGEAIGLYCISQDITVQKEKDTQLGLLTDSIPGGMVSYAYSPIGIRITYCNSGFCNLYGLTFEQYVASIKENHLAFVYVEDQKELINQFKKFINNETSMECLYRIHTASGGFRWIHHKAVLADHQGDTYYINAVLLDVTEQQEEKERLRLAEEEYRIATEHSARTICRYNIAEKSLKIAYEAAMRLALPTVIQGVPYSEIDNGSISSDTVDSYIAFYERILNGEKTSACVFCKKLKNNWRWLSARSTSTFDSSGRPLSAIISYVDITEAQEKEVVYKKWIQSLTEKNPEQYTLYRYNLNKDGSYETKEGSLFKYVVEDTNLKSFYECTLKFANQYVSEDDHNKYLDFLNRDRLLTDFHNGARSGNLIFRMKFNEDDIRWIQLTVELIEYPNSTDIEAYLMYEDINDKTLEELHIKKLAETDPLTGLQNRKIFIERFYNIISQHKKGSYCVMLLLDIDGFKLINDTFGHDIGDESIVNMANTICSVIPENGFVCRLGGDEFLICLPDMPNKDFVADKARELCEAAHKTTSNNTQMSVSIGIALNIDSGDDFDSMYHKADKALYHVKDHGKNNFAFYEADMERDDNEVISDVLSASLTPLSHSKNTMLIVDDSAINRLIHARFFKNEFTIVEAENGQLALDYLLEHSNDVAIVLLDIMMPVMDGYQLLEVMKNDLVLQKIPVIVISGEDDRKASLRAIKAGASDYVTKPVDAELLRLRVCSALNKIENEKLRIQNEHFTIDSQELCSYRCLMNNNSTVMIEYSEKNKTFKYAPKTGTYLSGTFDERPIWQIFAEDHIASDTDAETIRKLITESERPCQVVLNLMTPDGTSHPFIIKVTMRNAFINDDLALITFTDKK